MGFNNEIQPQRLNITEIVGRMREKDYFVDRSFQRRLVWTNKQQVRLIETVLMDYPMPEVYFWEQNPDVETGKQRSSIVDGQQRLTTIRQFMDNEWPLKKSSLDKINQDKEYAGKYWKDLTPEIKSHILQYNINARRIPSRITESEIRLIFARLNETDRSLNPQELRNATLNGKFLQTAEKLADSDQMSALDIFSPNDIRRMKDVEFASQLLGYERRGIVDDTAETINALYDMYSDQYANSDEDSESILNRLDMIIEIFKDAKVREFFESQNYVYTLQGLLDIEPDRTVAIWQKSLAAFAAEYKASAAQAPEEVEKELSDFRRGASSRTLSKISRTQRLFALRNWIRNYLKEPIRDAN